MALVVSSVTKKLLAKMVHSQEDHAFFARSIGPPTWGVQYF